MCEINKTKEELVHELKTLKQENSKLKKLLKGTQKGSDFFEISSTGTQPQSGINLNGITQYDESIIRQLFDDYIRMYANRDSKLTSYFSENFSGFTGGGDFLVKNKEEWVAITLQDFSQVKDPIRIEIKDLSIQLLSETVAVTNGFFIIHLPIEDQILSRETARLVLIFRKESAGWKITHSSISIPYYLVRKGEVYPMHELERRNRILEELAAKRTAQLSEANDKLHQSNKKLAKEIEERRYSDKALRESERKYHFLIDSANEAVVVIQDGKLKLTNPVTMAMIGCNEAEIYTSPIEMFIHPEDRATVIGNHKKRLRGGKVPNYYFFRLLNRDGSTRWVYMNAVLIDWEGRPATLNFMTDVTELKLAEEALQHSSRKWEALISASPDGIGMTTIDGHIKLISEKLVEMHGYSTSEIKDYIGKSIFEFIDPSSHYMLTENMRKLINGVKEKRITEYLAIKKDKSRFYIDVKASLLLDSSGNPESILYVERDITERKMAEEAIKQSNQKLEAIISASPDGIGMLSLDGKIQLMSDKLPEMYGYSIEQKDELIGRSAFDFIDPSNHMMVKENIQKLLAGENDNKLNEYIAIKKDNSRFYIDVNSAVLFDSSGSPSNILFVERDITERRKSESIIQQQYKQLEELNNTKDKFFSVIAHDLKSPFQSLLSSSELLAEEIESLSNDEIKFYSSGINSSLKNLFGLLENLLQWSLMQRNLLEFKPEYINLNSLTNNIIEISNKSAEKKNISILNKIDECACVYADADMLRSVIQNLITNAIKFSYKNGQIIVSCINKNDMVEISVLDNGMGMDPDKAYGLFNLNSINSTNGTAGEKGTGLGLSLCKEFVERNGGKIWLESKQGFGSKFSFEIPRRIV